MASAPPLRWVLAVEGQLGAGWLDAGEYSWVEKCWQVQLGQLMPAVGLTWVLGDTAAHWLLQQQLLQ